MSRRRARSRAGWPRPLPCRPGALFLLFAAFILAVGPSCAHAPREARPGVSYSGVATWYGDEFHGRPTASGEIFDMNKMTAAHRTFPFGTRLKVTNPANGRSVVVVVNDRGPFVRGRELDLSKAAARSIGVGCATVDIEVLGREPGYVRPVRTGSVSGGGPYRVQVGSFADPWNAEHLKLGLEMGYGEVRIQKARVDETTFHRVQVGAFDSREDAEKAAGRLAAEGYDTLIVR